MAVPAGAGEAARFAIHKIIDALGWTLEPSKSEGPSPSMVILGLRVCFLAYEGVVSVNPEPAKVEQWLSAIDHVLQSRKMTSSEASKLAGKLLFARSAWCGRVGNAQLRRLFQRAHGNGSSSLNEPLRRVLVWWRAMLQHQAFDMKVKLQPDQRKPVLLYTDATGKGRMGYAMYDCDGVLRTWSMIKTPLLCAAALHKRKTQVTAWETIAPVWALLQESTNLAGKVVWVFVDNVGAEFVLRKGSSKVDDINGYCAAFWILAVQNNVDVRVFRVPSKENPADAPSRGFSPFGATPGNRASTFVAPTEGFLSGAQLLEVVPHALR